MLQRYHGETDDARFDLLPAIDLRGGQVVRLVQGDFAQATTYGDEPAAIAAGFVEEGAGWLHVVDLDGARDGRPANADAVRAIVARVAARARVEVAGGLRTAGAVDLALAAGAARVVVGTAALRDPAFAARLVERHGAARIVAAIDVRDDRALGDGWRADAPGTAVDDAIVALADAGISTFEVTAVARDGLLGGPDLDLLQRVVAAGRGTVIASGGIARLEDLDAVRAIGCRGAIVGRAIYEGRFSVRQAIESLSA